MKKISLYEIYVPEYTVDKEPDHDLVGSKVDALFKEHFLDKKIIVRCLSMVDHVNLTLDELVNIIIKTGTDRYDPNIAGDRYDNVEDKHIDIFALEIKVTEEEKIFKNFTVPFYEYPLEMSGTPMRLDLVTVYDASKFNNVLHSYGDGRIKDDAFTFKDSKNKQEAVLAVIKIL